MGFILGVHFRAPVLGSSFWVQFLGPVLGPSFGSDLGPKNVNCRSHFWDQIRVHFWGPNFSLAYIVNKGWIPGPSFGTKNGPSSGTKKIGKTDQIWHPNVGPNLILQTQIQIWHPNKGPDLASKKGSISGTQLRDLIWL